MMWNVFSTLAILTMFVSGTTSNTDPDCSVAIQIGNSKRTTTYDPGSCDGEQCDNFIAEAQWYRLDGLTTGVRMPETCVPVWHCGTYAPIWLNGAHPSAQYPGPTVIPICAQLAVNGDCCGWSSSVQVKWCQDDANNEYFIYQLQVPPFCNMAYCAGSGVNCGTNAAWNDVLQNCTTPQFPPLTGSVVLSQPYISANTTVTDVNGNPFVATRFGVKCTFTYQNGVQKVDDGARFDVLFFADGTLVYKTTLTSMQSTAVVLDELYLAGHLDHNLICSVSSYWTAPYPTRNAYSDSNSIYFGIQITDINGNILSLTVIDGETASLKIQPTFPVTTADCFSLSPGTPCNPNYQFQIFSQNIYLSNCTFTLSSAAPSASIVLAPIPEPNTRFGEFPFFFAAGNTIQTQSSVFSGYVSNTIQVTTTRFANPNPWITCSSSGDPHISTFFGSYYSFQYPLDFIMFEDVSKNIQIQTRLYECGGNPVYCHCGVIAREGNNIIGVDGCNKPGPVVTRYLLDTTNPGGTVVIQNGWYKITLLSGVEIDYLHTSTLSISCKNSGSYDGLCSHSSPSTMVCAPQDWSGCPSQWQGQCIQDCLSYSVSGTASLFNIDASTSASSLCLSSPAVQPSCNCQNGASSPCHNVLDQSIPLPALHSCPPFSSKRRRRDTNSDPGAQPMAYYPTSPTSAESTQQTYTEQEALDACISGLSGTTSFSFCTNTIQVNTSSIIDFCVMDVLATNDVNVYPTFTASQLEILCSQAIQNPSSGNKTEQQQQFDQLVCPNQCNGNGKCQNGTCFCNAGFMSDDCSIMQGAVPSILSAVFDVCDIRQDDCLAIYLNAANISNGATCKIRNAGFTYYDNFPAVNMGSVTCSLQPAPVNTDGSSFSTTEYTIFVSLSNDQKTFSNEQAFTVYDGLCVFCDDTGMSCENLTTACNICGRCYASQSHINSTSNFVCNPSNCLTKWSTGTSHSCADGYDPCTSSHVSVSGLVLLLSYIFYATVKEI